MRAKVDMGGGGRRGGKKKRKTKNYEYPELYRGCCSEKWGMSRHPHVRVKSPTF